MQNQALMREPTKSEQDVADRLVFLRLAMGYTNQSEFARQSDIAVGDWNHFEKNRRQLPLSAARKLRIRWRVTHDWLYEGDESGLSWDVKKTFIDFEEQQGARA